VSSAAVSGSEARSHGYQCNHVATRKPLKIHCLVLPPILIVQEFRYRGENANRLPRLLRSGQLDCKALNRYSLIPKRLIFESKVRVGSPGLAAAPVGPEIRP
jgi:hypothetical protein